MTIALLVTLALSAPPTVDPASAEPVAFIAAGFDMMVPSSWRALEERGRWAKVSLADGAGRMSVWRADERRSLKGIRKKLARKALKAGWELVERRFGTLDGNRALVCLYDVPGAEEPVRQLFYFVNTARGFFMMQFAAPISVFDYGQVRTAAASFRARDVSDPPRAAVSGHERRTAGTESPAPQP